MMNSKNQESSRSLFWLFLIRVTQSSPVYTHILYIHVQVNLYMTNMVYTYFDEINGMSPIFIVDKISTA